ncbi:MAG: hypothetical protein ACT4UQ_11915 [Gammaproteobacteria bacterium]
MIFRRQLVEWGAAESTGGGTRKRVRPAVEFPGGVSHIISRSGGSEGIGLIVTSNMAQRLLFGEPTVWSGLEGYLLTPELATALNMPGGAPALLVQRVAEGSPAARMGLRGGTLPATIGQESFVVGGDIVLVVEGIGIGAPSAYELIRRRLIEIQATRGSVSVTVLRDGKAVEISARLGR